MARDAFEPPHTAWPRTPDGSTDRQRVPTGLHWQRDPKTGKRVRVDVTPRYPSGAPIPDPPPNP